MQDDQAFNIRFVGLIKAHPCLYDNNRTDYYMAHIQEKSWAEIAKETGKGVTSAECKSRWRNLRGSYTKHLKKYRPFGSGPSAKRPYYLAEHLAFVQPFTKFRKAPKNDLILAARRAKKRAEQNNENSRSNLSNDESHVEEVYENAVYDVVEEMNISEMFEDQKTNSEKPNTLKDLLMERSKRKKNNQSQITLNDVNKSAFEYFETKKRGMVGDDDDDTHFLLSLRGDVKKMTDSQKRRFKMCTQKLAWQILDETSSDSFSQHSSPQPSISHPFTIIGDFKSLPTKEEPRSEETSLQDEFDLLPKTL